MRKLLGWENEDLSKLGYRISVKRAYTLEPCNIAVKIVSASLVEK
ncbi:MAG: hypothetical protein ACON4R_06970 [Akkermansiaceae bacterium]